MRTTDPAVVAPAIEWLQQNAPVPVDPVEWLKNPDNIALLNDNGDLAIFEKGVKDIYSGHYFFKSRGRQALEAGRFFLDELFNTCYNIPILMGLTPLDNLGARWVSRQLGFTSYGAIDFKDKDYEMFIITKKEYNDKWER